MDRFGYIQKPLNLYSKRLGRSVGLSPYQDKNNRFISCLGGTIPAKVCYNYYIESEHTRENIL